VSGRVTGVARDASDLSCFADAQFDLVFASASLHHTLKYPNALSELARVIRTGGKLILAETYGNNRVLNWTRRLNWRLQSQSEDAGEDIILGDRELAILRPFFSTVRSHPMNLTAMVKRLFRGHFDRVMVAGVLKTCEQLDTRLIRAFPALSRYCGEVLVVAVK